MDNETDTLKRELNLTDLDIDVFRLLIQTRKSLNVNEMTLLLPERGDNLYRTLNKLVKKGLVTKTRDYPTRFQAMAYNSHVIPALEGKKSEITQLISILSGKQPRTSSKIRVFGSRAEYRDYGARRFLEVNESVSLIVSGISQPADFFKSHIDLVQRGVTVKMLITKYTEANQEMYEHWKKNGIDLRKIDKPGINLIIYDQSEIQIAAKESPTTKDKHGISITNEYLVPFITDYFEILWEKAEAI